MAHGGAELLGQDQKMPVFHTLGFLRPTGASTIGHLCTPDGSPRSDTRCCRTPRDQGGIMNLDVLEGEG